MTTVTVRCDGNAAAGWTCVVTLADGGRSVSTHAVRVSFADLARLAPTAASPEDLVRRSFAFLLDREPPSAILRSFDLSVISRYFPDYESVIRRDNGSG